MLDSSLNVYFARNVWKCFRCHNVCQRVIYASHWVPCWHQLLWAIRKKRCWEFYLRFKLSFLVVNGYFCRKTSENTFRCDNTCQWVLAIECHRLGIVMERCNLTMKWQVFVVQIKTIDVFVYKVSFVRKKVEKSLGMIMRARGCQEVVQWRILTQFSRWAWLVKTWTNGFNAWFLKGKYLKTALGIMRGDRECQRAQP